MSRLEADLLLRAYEAGIFPMAEDAGSETLFWVDPEERGILPLDGFHLSRRLARTLRAERFEVACDRDFTGVMRGCAEATEMRPKTWINEELVRLYSELHRRGVAHSIECRRDGALAGGLYGVALGGAFFGESMFSRATDASKVALAHLVALLRRGGYTLLDVQFVTPHLRQFGAVEVPRQSYRRALLAALRKRARWPGETLSGVDAVDAICP
jgi:leucyl/phenylalanyl-tRNA---protein transferase